MSNEIYIIGEIGKQATLTTLRNDVEKTDPSLPINIYIHSEGGSLFEGYAMYKYLKGLDRDINTKSAGLVASIATLPFLAGNRDTRVVNATDSFLIHLPLSGQSGNAVDLERTAKILRDWENKLSDIYVNETNLTKEEALDLMTKDEFLNVEVLKEKGFVNEIVKFKAVASLINNPNNNMKDNVTKEEVDGLLSKFFNKFFPKTEVVNKLVQDANGVEIDFYELEDDATVVVGSAARIESADAEGDYIMPSGETYKFVGGKLDEIMPSEDEAEGEDTDAKIKELTDANAELTNQITELTNKLDESNGTVDEIKNEFTSLKASITSKFDYDEKDSKDKGNAPKSRSLFKN